MIADVITYTGRDGKFCSVRLSWDGGAADNGDLDISTSKENVSYH